MGSERPVLGPDDVARMAHAYRGDSDLGLLARSHERLRDRYSEARAALARYEALLQDAFLFADERWEERNEGHDWAEWCRRARRALREAQQEARE